MVFADLPYGLTKCLWDSLIPWAPLWAQLNRVCRQNAAMIFTATQPFTTALINSNPKAFRYCLTWEKTVSTGFLNARRMPLRSHEDVVVFYRRLPTYNPQMTSAPMKVVRSDGTSSVVYGKASIRRAYASDQRYPKSVIRIASEAQNTSVHPTQKPVGLMSYLIRTYSDPGDLILDPTMGSGSTGVAALNESRSFIGIERDPSYYATAQARISEAQVSAPTRK